MEGRDASFLWSTHFIFEDPGLLANTASLGQLAGVQGSFTNVRISHFCLHGALWPGFLFQCGYKNSNSFRCCEHVLLLIPLSNWNVKVFTLLFHAELESFCCILPPILCVWSQGENSFTSVQVPHWLEIPAYFTYFSSSIDSKLLMSWTA